METRPAPLDDGHLTDAADVLSDAEQSAKETMNAALDLAVDICRLAAASANPDAAAHAEKTRVDLFRLAGLLMASANLLSETAIELRGLGGGSGCTHLLLAE